MSRVVEVARSVAMRPHCGHHRSLCLLPLFSRELRDSYDTYDLLVTETLDAVGNRAQAVSDYRVLQPRLVTEPNGNRSEAAFDALGMVVGMAVMG